MSKLLFYFRAIRTNLRTAPLAALCMVMALSIAFVGEAWLLRIDYKTPSVPRTEDVMLMIYMSIAVCCMIFVYMAYMYGYWLKITAARNLPYKRLGAPRYVLLTECALELLLILAIACLIGLGFDRLLNYIAPYPRRVRYIDAMLFFKTAGVMFIPVSAVFLFHSFYKRIASALKRVRVKNSDGERK